MLLIPEWEIHGDQNEIVITSGQYVTRLRPRGLLELKSIPVFSDNRWIRSMPIDERHVLSLDVDITRPEEIKDPAVTDEGVWLH
ncbi:hypothetical protein [Nocardia grenadensis]|uniref:hypothetical protein n=1 Tax=Nocardia grenadensis TaxID=931537 RepID=UPI003D75B9C0